MGCAVLVLREVQAPVLWLSVASSLSLALNQKKIDYCSAGEAKYRSKTCSKGIVRVVAISLWLTLSIFVVSPLFL